MIVHNIEYTRELLNSNCDLDFIKSLVIRVTGKDKLIENKEILDHIEEIFKKYVTTPINEQNRKQALLPSKAKIFKNNYGTASGMWFEKNGQVIISLPGVPFEMKSLMTNEVIPKLQNYFTRPFIVHKTIITYGLGESAIAEIISTWENFGKPSNFNIVELGPGYGSLTMVLIDVFKRFPKFNSCKNIYLFETSSILKKIQKKNINNTKVKWI